MNTAWLIWVRVGAENQGPLQQKKREPESHKTCQSVNYWLTWGVMTRQQTEVLSNWGIRWHPRYLLPPPIHTQHNSPNKIPLMQLRYSPELPALQHLHHISIWMSTSEMATEQSIHWHRTKELIHNKHISRWSHASWPVLYFFWSFGH